MANPRILLIDEDNNSVASELNGAALAPLDATLPAAAVTAVLQFNQIDTDASTLSKVMDFAGKVIAVWAKKTSGNGGASCTATLSNAGNTLATATLNQVDNTQIFDAVVLNDAFEDFAAGDTLLLTAAKTANDCAAKVYVMVART